jgi:hypothetical protein
MPPEMAEDKFAMLRQQAEEILQSQPANLADSVRGGYSSVDPQPASPPT